MSVYVEGTGDTTLVFLEKKTVSSPKQSFIRCVLWLLAKLAGTDQLGQSLHGLLLVGAVGDQGDGGALHDAQGEYAQQALGIKPKLLCEGT